MDAGFVDVEGEGNGGAAQGGGEQQGVFHRHGGVGGGVPNEAGWGVGGDVQFVGEVTHEVGGRGFAEEVLAGAGVAEFAERDDRVTKDAEVGAGAFALDRVGGIGRAGIEVGEQGGGEVAAGGGADDADTGGVATLATGGGAEDAQGAGGVVQHGRVAITARAEAVVEHVGGHAEFGEPAGVALALVRGEMAVAAAGQDEYASSVGRAGGGVETRERGDVGGVLAQRAGGSVGPEREGAGVVMRADRSGRGGLGGRVVEHDAFLFLGVVAGDEGEGLLGVAEVEGLVGDVGRDEDEIAGLVDHRLAKAAAVEGFDAALEQVDGGLEAGVVVGVGAAGGRDDDEVHGEPGAAGGGARDAEKIGQPLLRHGGGGGADGDDVVAGAGGRKRCGGHDAKRRREGGQGRKRRARRGRSLNATTGGRR